MVQYRGFNCTCFSLFDPQNVKSLVKVSVPWLSDVEAFSRDVGRIFKYGGNGQVVPTSRRIGWRQSGLDTIVARSDVRSLSQSRGFTGRAGIIAMTNVTKKNFSESLERLKRQLQGADFVAMDLEMTGVDSTTWRRNLELDSCETRYQNLKHSAEKFAVWQCGVCPFKWDKANKGFIAYPHNFFIFPRNELQLGLPLRRFFAQTTSLEFLAKHRFDFNACVYGGISYLSHEQEAAARVLLGLLPGTHETKQKLGKEPDNPVTRSGDDELVERFRNRIGNWRDELLYNRQKWQLTEKPGTTGKTILPSTSLFAEPSSADDSIIREDIAVGTSPGSLRPSLSFDVSSSHQMSIVQQVIRTYYDDLVAVVKKKSHMSDQSQIHVIFTSSMDDKVHLLQELADEEQKELKARVADAIGFRKVIDAIIEAGLPVVGHNCILDMIHIHSKFMSPLPASLRQFSTSLLQRFPCIIDTKYLLRSEPTLRGVLANRSTSLATVFSHFCQGFEDRDVASGRFYFGKGKILNTSFSRVAIEVAEDMKQAKDTGLKHEAGFDAYMTGSVFAQACHLLHIDATTIRHLPNAVKAGEQGLATYANLLALGWVGNMVLDLTTGKEATGVKAFQGPCPSMNRHFEYCTVALVWGFPSGCKEQEIRLIVQRVFGSGWEFLQVNVTIVDDSAAFVRFKDPQTLVQFLQLMQESSTADPDEMSLQTLRAAPYEAYELLCQSPLTTECLAESADILQLQHFLPRKGNMDIYADGGLHSKVQENYDSLRLVHLTKERIVGGQLPSRFDWDAGATRPVLERDEVELAKEESLVRIGLGLVADRN